MSLAPVRFVVPMPENLTNRRSGGSHWRTIHREKRAYQDMLDLAMGVPGTMVGAVRCDVPMPPAQPWPRVRIRSVMHLGAAMDDDNAMARHKPLLDWLKKRRYILDDRRTCVTWEGFPEQRVERKSRANPRPARRIELTLTPFEG